MGDQSCTERPKQSEESNFATLIAKSPLMISSDIKGRNYVFICWRRDGEPMCWTISTALWAGPAPRNLLHSAETFSSSQQLPRGAWAPLPSELTSRAVRYRIAVAVWAAANRAAPWELTGCPERSCRDALAWELCTGQRAETWPQTRDMCHQEQGCPLLLHTTFGIQILLLSCSAVLAQSPPSTYHRQKPTALQGGF